MSNVWKAGPDVITTMQSLIAKHFPLLAGIDDQILVVFKEKATKSGDQVIAGTTSKASPLLGVVSEKDYKFLITLAQDEWQSLNDKDREALLFHHLCGCGTVEDSQTGDVKTFKRLPDVSFYRAEVELFGFWRTTGATPAPDLISDLFGDPPAPPAPTNTPAKKP